MKSLKDYENDVKSAVDDPVEGLHQANKATQAVNPMSYATKEGTVAGDFARGDIGGGIKDSQSHAGQKKRDAEDAARAKANDIYSQGQGYNSQLDATGKKYLDQMDSAHTSANNTYTNSILPNLKNLMERARTDSASSMTLAQAMDPNNKVASDTRALYEQQAQNEGRQQLASTSVLQALGNRNLATEMGSAGAPMTGGQLQALMGANQAQTGSYYAQGQRRQQDLRDTGLQQGFARSDQAYNQGLDAQQRFGNTTSAYGNANFQMLAGDESNAGLHNAVDNQSLYRQQALDAQKNGADMSAINANIAAANAQQQAQSQMGTAALGAVGTGVGAYFGGPAGAAAGNKIGTSVGQAAASTDDSYGYQSPYQNYSGAPDYVQQGSQNQNYGGLSSPYNPYSSPGASNQIVNRQGFQSINPYQRRTV